MISLKKLQKKINKKNISNLILALVAYIFYYTIYLFIPYPIASKIGYLLGVLILAKAPIKRKHEVIKNIELCFPDKPKSFIKNIYKESCGNFVRSIFEMPKMNKGFNVNKYVKIHDEYNIKDYSKNHNIILIGAHMGNWEAFSVQSNYFQNLFYAIYKPPKNPYLKQLIFNMRLHVSKKLHTIQLNKNTIINFNRKLSNKEPINPIIIAMFTDQKTYEGIPTTLFGRKVTTLHFLPKIALKYNIKMVPVRCTRVNGIYFDLHIEKPLEIIPTGNKEEDVKMLTQANNNKIEEWITKYPEQWFWLHRRW